MDNKRLFGKGMIKVIQNDIRNDFRKGMIERISGKGMIGNWDDIRQEMNKMMSGMG